MKNNTLLILFTTALLAGCSPIKEKLANISIPEIPLPPMPTIYRADIEQGNIIEQSIVEKLKPGMNKNQVRYIMGSPLIIDPLHQQRWDYFFSKKSDGKIEEKKRVTLFFENSKLVRIEGDVLPTK